MGFTYERNNKMKRIVILDEVDSIKDKDELINKLGKSNARLSELSARLSEVTEALEKEKKLNQRLVAKRYDIYKLETVEELKVKCGGKLPSKRKQIEIYFSEGRGYDEIELLTDAKPEYIYKVVSEYRKRKGIKKEEPKRSEKEEEIIAARMFCKDAKQVAKSADVSLQYVYRVLKKYDISFKRKR
jgi:predicted RND superfamily exporter protein